MQPERRKHVQLNNLQRNESCCISLVPLVTTASNCKTLLSNYLFINSPSHHIKVTRTTPCHHFFSSLIADLVSFRGKIQKAEAEIIRVCIYVNIYSIRIYIYKYRYRYRYRYIYETSANAADLHFNVSLQRLKNFGALCWDSLLRWM